MSSWHNMTSHSTFNTSNFTRNDTANNSSEKPLWFWVISVFISVMTVFGNGLVIYVLATKRRLLTSANWFVMSLSAADFLIGLFLPPMSAICTYGYQCNRGLFYLFYNSIMFVSVMNIFTMTLDRFMSIVYPLKYHRWMSNRRVAVMIAVSWFLPVLLCFIPITWTNMTTAEIATPKRAHAVTMLIMFEFLPPVLMLMMYFQILLTARRHARQTATQIAQLNFNRHTRNNTTSNYNRTERSVRVIGAVVLLFVGCWLLDIYKSICWHFEYCHVNNDTVNASLLLLYFNSAVNPLVYALLKNDFKQELKKLFCCQAVIAVHSTFEMTDNKGDRAITRNSLHYTM